MRLILEIWRYVVPGRPRENIWTTCFISILRDFKAEYKTHRHVCKISRRIFVSNCNCKCRHPGCSMHCLYLMWHGLGISSQLLSSIEAAVAFVIAGEEQWAIISISDGMLKENMLRLKNIPHQGKMKFVIDVHYVVNMSRLWSYRPFWLTSVTNHLAFGNSRVSQKRALPGACRKLAGDYNRLLKVFNDFEYKT